MINIYCLIHPITRHPFYVGATKLPINIRLSGHICEYNTYRPDSHSVKMKYIGNLLQQGIKPKVRLLYVATLHSVDHYERFFYDLFKQQGYNLLQKDTAFSYKKKATAQPFKYKHKMPKKYLQLCYNNILIIIW